MANSGSVWVGSSGCLLPFLIIFNFLFGRALFDSTRMWLGVEAILILIFVLKVNTMARKINQQFRPEGRGWTSNSPSHRPGGRGWASDSQKHSSKGKVIDVQGHVVQEDKRLK